MIPTLPIDPKVGATAVLGVELALAVLLLVGTVLVRRGNVRWHAHLQGFAVLANLPAAAVWMLPPYLDSVWPGLPGKLAEPFFLYPTLMLVTGIAVEALGVYVVLVAGTNWLPESLRFRRYKAWMRTVLGLWWFVVLLGVTTYYYWVIAPG